MQGLDAAYILILMDGVPLVGRSVGTFDLSRISVGNIDRIEIMSFFCLYMDLKLLAGVINIITKKSQHIIILREMDPLDTLVGIRMM
jgi:outer membrane receptor for ferrienterochelin and colicins